MNAEHPVLLTVDLQLSLVPGALPDPIREALAGYLRAFRAAGLPIVHALGGSLVLRAEAAGEVIDPRLLPYPRARLYGQYLKQGFLQRLGPNEVALYMPGWGAFQGTSLESHLRALGADTVLVAGCRFEAGPRAVLREAGEKRFAAVLLEDAVSGMHVLARAETNRLGIALRGNRYGNAGAVNRATLRSRIWGSKGLGRKSAEPSSTSS